MTSQTTGSQIEVYRYRWVIIAVFAVINIVVQLQWLSFAPIAKAAQSVYGVSALQVDFFSIIYLAVFVIFCIPASYVIITAVGAVIVLVFLREKPPTPPCQEGQDERFKVFEGLRHMLKNRDMLVLIMVFFLGLGMFNAITTCIDQICKLRGLNFEQTGLVGGMMLISGVLGSIVFPLISDKLRKRKAVFLFTGICSIPGLIGLTTTGHYWGMLISAFLMGFFFLGGAPVLFQFCAEINAPAPESTSQGLLMLAGQIGGILFVIGMNGLGMIPSMVVFIVFSLINAILFLLMRESKMIQSDLTGAMDAPA